MQEALYKEENHVDVADALNNMGVAYERLGTYEQSHDKELLKNQ